MPIVISRSGEMPSEIPSISQAQKDAAWEYIIRTWLKNHPEELKSLIGDKAHAV